MRYIKNKTLIMIITIYLFITINLISRNAVIYTNIINPIFWGSLFVYLIRNKKKNYIRFYINKKPIIYMVIISCIHIVLYFYIGFIFGFSKSPYNHDIISILKNCLIQIMPIFGIEYARAIILTRNKNNKKVIVYTTMLFILLGIKYNVLFNLFSNKEEFFKFICSSIIPQIAVNILYTYLNLNWSCLPVLIYRFFKEITILLLPILPNIDWFVIGSVDILSPLVIYLIFKYKLIKEKNSVKKTKKNLFEKISYIITLVLSINLICFMLGLFKYEPIAILSDSMSPTFARGDVLVYKKLDDNSLNNVPINSIIIYSIENQNIAHRVINVIDKDGSILYQTKGDKNNAPDMELVRTNQIKGIYTFHIKYIGFPSVWLHDYFMYENAKVETK